MISNKYVPDYPGRKEKMNWWALRKNKCPKCGDDLDFSGSMVICSSRLCSFSISPARMQEIVANQNAKDVEDKLTN